jgi:tetratricopeptide (TPR) repeat protein
MERISRSELILASSVSRLHPTRQVLELRGFMSHHSYGSSQSQKQRRPFAGRQDLLNTFSTALARPLDGSARVIAFHGVGGIGKTRLLEEMWRQLLEDSSTRAYGWLDFRDPENRRPTTALARLRGAFRRAFDVSFPSFDIAFAIHWALAYPHIPITKSEFPFLTEGEIAGDVISALRELPVVGIAARLPRVVERASQAVREWWLLRGQSELRSLLTLNDPNAVAERLPSFWNADIRAWLEQSQERRVIVFLDTYEALWDGSSSSHSDIVVDEWVSQWASDLGDVLLVIGGRNEVKWEVRGAILQPVVENHRVDPLSPADCHSCLSEMGIVDQELRSTIVERSHGVPAYLDLAALTHERINRNEGRVPRKEEFDENLDALVDTFLRYLSISERSTLLILSVPETFDKTQFKDLIHTFSTGYPSTSLGLIALTKHSFVESIGAERFALHPLVRDALEAIHDPDERLAVRSHLFQRATETLSALERQAITNVHRHAFREGYIQAQSVLEPSDFFKWYWTYEEPFAVAGDWRLLRHAREAVLAYAQRTRGLTHENTLSATTALASVRDEEGHLQAAESLHRDALRLAEQLFGPTGERTLQTGGSLAELLNRRGRLDEAGALFKRILNGCEQNLGRSHSTTLSVVNSFAIHLRTRGQLSEAEPLYRRVIDGLEETSGAASVETLTAVNNLARVLHLLGRFEEAQSLFERALQGIQHTLGADHLTSLMTASNLGLLLQDRGRLTEARGVFEHTIARAEGHLGAEHPVTLTFLANLAAIMVATGDFAEAEQPSRRVCDLRERVLGPEHPDTLSSINNLGILLYRLDRDSEAETLLRRAYADSRRVLGVEHHSTLVAANNLSACLLESGRLKEGVGLTRETFELCERSLGPEHPQTLTSLDNLAVMLGEQGEFDTAVRLSQRASEARERTLGADHPDTLTSNNNFAVMMTRMGQYAKAEVLFRDVVEKRRLHLGARHPATQTSVKNLVQVLRELGRDAEAASLELQAIANRDQE